VSVVGSGTADETTPANKLFCSSPQTTPSWMIGSTCLAGTPAGEYGQGWTVRYVATASDGWQFVRWQSDGTTREAVVCDGATGSTYTGTACQFGTFNNYQTQAVFEDVTAPTPGITGGPPASSTSGRSVTFTFGVSTNPAGQPTTYTCRLTGPGGLVQDWTSCSATGKAYSSLSDGAHTFDVRASDPSGNNSTASRSWTVDAIAPETLLTEGPAASSTVRQRTAQFQFTASGDPAKFVCAIDDVTVADPCASPYTTSSLGDGSHKFEVWAVDGRDNVETSPAQRTWVIDGTAPDTTIAGGPAEGSSTTSTTAAFTLSASEASTYRCSLNGATATACSSSYALSGLAQQTHVLQVWATDSAGNEDASPATRTWTVVADSGTGTGTGTGTGGATGGNASTTTETPVATTLPAPVETQALPSPVTTLAAPAVAAALKSAHKAFRRYTILSKLTLAGVTDGATVLVRCRGKKCPVKVFTKTGGGTVNLTRFLRRRLPVGTVLEISVTKAAHVAKVFTLRIRARRAPLVRIA
jgi:hypothetical protein